MKVLLINPKPLGNIRGANSSTPPLGLAFLAAVLEKENYKVKFIDMNVQDIDIGKEIKKEQPDWVGLTATTALVESAWKLAELTKKVSNAKVMIGGCHVTALPKESAEKSFIDVVVKGEGEITVPELLKKKDWSKVKGITYKDKNRKIRDNANRTFMQDLDKLPHPSWHLFPMKKYHNYQPFLLNRSPCGVVMTVRGCPMNCSFCAIHSIMGRGARIFSVDWVEEEWRRLVEDYKCKEIAVLDEAFTVIPSRTKELCKKISKFKIPWSLPNGIRVDRVNEDLLRTMKRAGCYRLGFGIESGNQKILDLNHKNITLEKVRETTKLAYKIGFTIVGFFMLGNLGENRKTIEETIEFSKTLPIHFAVFTTASPVPGSELYNEVKKRGKFLVNEWSKFGQYDEKSLFELDEVNDELIKDMSKKSYRSFYLRPKQILRLLRLKETWFNFGSYLKTGVTLLGGTKENANSL